MLDGLLLLIQGFLLGVAIAAPVGPIGLLCIRRTLEHGPAVGFATGIGAAVADTIFGAIAAYGVTTVLSFVSGRETLLRFLGALFLFVIAYATYHHIPRPPDRMPNSRDWFVGFLVGLTLTLTNPITILACLALFAGFGLADALSTGEASTVVLGVFLGSAAWWLTLSIGTAMIRHRLNEDRLVLINRYTAVALALFGVWAVATAVMSTLSYPETYR